MKKLGYLFMMCLLVAFTSCSSSVDESINTTSSLQEKDTHSAKPEKFEYGVRYAIKNLPSDIYDYYSKDVLDKFFSELRGTGDTIIFFKDQLSLDNFMKPNPTEVKGINNLSMPVYMQYSATLGSYSSLVNSFSLYLSVTYQKEGNSSLSVGFTDMMALQNLSIKYNRVAIHSIYYTDCISAIHQPCVSGIECNFTVTGEILSTSSGVVHSARPLYDFSYEGIATSAGNDYNTINGYIESK